MLDDLDEELNESYGDDEHLTDLGKETIGTLRQLRAKGYPYSRIQCFLDHDIGRCHASRPTDK